MPTEFIAQNGIVKSTRQTKIAVTGCPKAKKAASASSSKRQARDANKKR